MPTLYIIATPIGNLEDISLRALRLLDQVALIAAEDTRTTQHLLKKYKIETALTSYYEHNKLSKLDHLISVLKENDVALVSEAGMPGISDTGIELVNAALENNIAVVPVPGASAIVTAAAASGLPVKEFIYLGFLPRRKGERSRLLGSVAEQPRTMVIFESPHRLCRSLEDMLEVLGDRRIAVCRELTKLHEEIFRGTVREAIEHFKSPVGEFTLVIEGCPEREGQIDDTIEKQLLALYRNGMSAKEAVACISATSGIPKKKIYQSWIRLTKGD